MYKLEDKSITILHEDPASKDALLLMNELSEVLTSITGASGRSSFDPEDVRVPRALFVIARSGTGEPIGCGAFRPMDIHTAEIKRMYARQKTRGVGTAILAYLEEQARGMGYTSLKLETRRINKHAVTFYEKRGYKYIPNYGKYDGNPEAVCFEKHL